MKRTSQSQDRWSSFISRHIRVAVLLLLRAVVHRVMEICLRAGEYTERSLAGAGTLTTQEAAPPTVLSGDASDLTSLEGFGPGNLDCLGIYVQPRKGSGWQLLEVSGRVEEAARIGLRARR